MRLKVNEIFTSIQGEGLSAGYPTVFVRLTGCNLRCSYCDTSYSYSEGDYRDIDEIIAEIDRSGYKRVCLTGGEPLLHEGVGQLLEKLSEYEVSIETNGSVDLSDFKLGDKHSFTMDIKTPLSGEAESNNFGNFKFLRDRDEIKAVIGSREDYDWTREVLNKYYKKGKISFSPMYGQIDPRDIIAWILEDKIDVRFQIQIHKVIWDADERGV